MKVPKDVVVVAPCPACQELCVLFRGKVLPLDRKVIEQGSFEERRAHLAGIIAEFLDPSVFSIFEAESSQPEPTRAPKPPRLQPNTPKPDESVNPITEEEMDRFVRLELKCLDNPEYFKRHFG